MSDLNEIVGEDSLADPKMADASFMESDMVTFQGKLLEPFTGRRLYVAQAIGLKLFSLTTEEYEDFKDTKSYPGFYMDMALVVYLCSIPLSEVLKSLRRQEKTLDRALAWAEKNGASKPGDPGFSDMVEAFADILNRLFAAFSEPDPNQGDDDDDDSTAPEVMEDGSNP